MATTTASGTGGLRTLGILIIVAGAVFAVAGIGTWFIVKAQLSDEKITVSEDADHFAGKPVEGPFTAFAQANTIKRHGLEASGGKTYAELPQDDPRRDTVMTASFLRASLFTSIVAFGVAAFAVGIGLVLVLVGVALLRIEKGFAGAAAPPTAPAS